MKYSGIGGQAVIEGIMMKNKDQYATAVRRPDGGIEVKKDTYVSMTENTITTAISTCSTFSPKTLSIHSSSLPGSESSSSSKKLAE